MKFIYDGEYREFRGHVFKWRKPTTVTDPATISAIKKDPTFYEVKEEAEEEKVLDRYACPKCGKHVKQGHYLHVKHCRGEK
jgi:Zn finger protein HypA/HybF involved in hydrogenase expression